jgi:ribosome-associated protein
MNNKGGSTLNKKTEDKLHAILGFALDKLAYDMIVLDVEKICSYTDAIIVCHGASTRQTQAILYSVREEMKKKGTLPLGAEGEAEGQWAILDYGDVVLHIFYKPAREFYNIEGIWPDARRGTAQATPEGVALSWQARKRRKAEAG